jgi:ATP-dependent 26S proteasome regulatory subunit
MTTNRVIAFDPAILSRIHHAVNFDQLTLNQEKELWRRWLKRLEERNLCKGSQDIENWIERKHKQKNRLPLNGREIRNIFINAQSIALRKGKIQVGWQDLNRLYEYKSGFRNDTEGQRQQAEVLLAKPRGKG